MGKYSQMKMDEGTLVIIIYTKIQSCFFEEKRTRTFHLLLHSSFSLSKFWSSSSDTTLFFIRTSKILMRLNVFFKLRFAAAKRYS